MTIKELKELINNTPDIHKVSIIDFCSFGAIERPIDNTTVNSKDKALYLTTISRVIGEA